MATQEERAKALLERRGQTFAEELRIDVVSKRVWRSARSLAGRESPRLVAALVREDLG